MDNHEPSAEIKKQDASMQNRKADIARQALGIYTHVNMEEKRAAMNALQEVFA